MSRYRLKGFTPVPDEMIQKYGGTAALVYGRVWRYTDGGLRDCTASINTIAKQLKLTIPTVRKHLKTLIKEGEIVDKTPDLPNAPHTLNVITQLALTLEIKPEAAIKNFNSKDENAIKNFNSGYKESLPKDIKEDILKNEDKKPRGHNAVRKALGEEFVKVTGLSPPSETTAKAKRAAGALWWQPLREIAKETKWNQEQGIALIRIAVKRMRKEKLTISDPNSILKVAKAIMGEVSSGITTLDARSQREQRQAMHRAESDRHAEKRRRRIHAQDMARRMEDSEESESGTG